MSHFSRSKKGNVILDGLMVVIVLFVFAIFSVAAYTIWSEMEPELTADVIGEDAQATVQEIDTRLPSVLDGLFLFLFVGVWGIALIASFMVDAHPVFFVFVIVGLLAVIVVGVILGNFYEEFFTDDEFGDITDEFPITTWLLGNILYVVIAVAASIMIVLYAKGRGT